jgi:hypothetical protein
MKKHEKILEKLELDKKSLIRFCNMNNCHNEISQTKLNVINETIEYIKKL